MSLHGLLLVNKPSDITSHDVVASARRSLKTRDIGHAGTLDPLASGLMVLLIGEATKLSDFILNGNKGYRVRVQLGVRTDSLDMTGQVITETPCDINPEKIIEAANKLSGTFNWPVPLFSAVKVGGKKMYEYAHNDQIVDTPLKPMTFWNLKVLSAGSSYLEAELECSKGSFVRTWASQLGEALGVGGAVAELKRTISAPYSLEDAISLGELAENAGMDNTQLLGRAFIPVNRALPSWKAVTVGGKDEKLLNNGQISYDLERRLISEKRAAVRLGEKVGIKVLSAEKGALLAILEAQPNRGLKIRRVFKMT